MRELREQAMDSRLRGGDNAFRFVDMVIGELRSVDEALDNGARRARDSLRTGPRLPMQPAGIAYGSWSIGTRMSARRQAMVVRFYDGLPCCRRRAASKTAEELEQHWTSQCCKGGHLIRAPPTATARSMSRWACTAPFHHLHSPFTVFTRAPHSLASATATPSHPLPQT